MGVELSPDFVKEVSGTNGVFRENIINKHFHTAGCAPVMIPDMMEPTEEIQKICHGIFPDMLKAIEFFRKEQTEGN